MTKSHAASWYICQRDRQRIEHDMGILKRAIKYLSDDSSQKLSEITGWDIETCKANLRKAKLMGISDATYMRKAAYDLSDEELSNLKKTLDEAIAYKNKDEVYYAGIVKLRTGWSDEELNKRLKEANAMGIKNRAYALGGYWLKSEDELKEIGSKSKDEKAKTKEDKDAYLHLIMDKTGWKYGKAEYEMLKARASLGASYEDFYRFRFYDRDEEDRKRFPTLRVMDRFRSRYCSFEPRSIYFDDKANFNRTFADKIGRVWFTSDGLTFEEYKKRIAGIDRIIVKPLVDSCGNGISLHECGKSDEEDRKVYESIMAQGEVLIEECIKQHDEMARLCPTSVNTVRINTMNWNGECVFQFAILRTGTGDIIDNFHNGGIAARIDIENGAVDADAVDLDGNIIEENPYTHIKLRGFKIPHWDKILETCREINGRIEGVDYVGWDFAITPEGVELIEGNEGAYVMPQMCNLQDDIGLRPVLCDPYMEQ